MNRTPTNASVACVHEGTVLLLCRGATEPSCPGLWEFPGGRIRPEETPAQAAVREFMEECGSQVDLVGLAGEFSWDLHGKIRTEVVFVGRLVGAIHLGSEHSAYTWASADDLESGRYRVSGEVKEIALRLLRSNELP